MPEQKDKVRHNSEGDEFLRFKEEASFQFIKSGIGEYGKAIARYSLLDREPLLKIGKTDAEIAKSLASIKIDDPILEKRIEKIIDEDKSRISEDDAFLLAAVTSAKIKTAKEDRFLTPKEKGAWDGFEKGITEIVIQLIGSKDFRKKVGTLVAIGLSLTSCGGSVIPSEAFVATSLPVVYEESASPGETQEPIITLTVEEVTEIEESAQEIIDHDFVGLDVHDAKLVGRTFLMDEEGNKYALFEAQLPDVNTREDKDFIILGWVDNGVVKQIRGLVSREEEGNTGNIEYMSFFYDYMTSEITYEAIVFRLTTAGEIQAPRDGEWVNLQPGSGSSEEAERILRSKVLASPVMQNQESFPESDLEVSREEVAITETIEISGIGGFELAALEAGQIIEGFDNPDEMGWGQTEDGRWVIYDKSTGLAVETISKSEAERLKIAPGYEFKGNVRIGNSSEADTEQNLITVGQYLARGFFIDFVGPSEVNIVVNEEGENYPFGILRVFAPNANGQGGRIIETLIYMDDGYETESAFAGFDFAEVGGYAANTYTVRNMLEEIKTGDLLTILITDQGDLARRFPPDPIRIENDAYYKLSAEMGIFFANRAKESFQEYSRGEKGPIELGPTNQINAFTAE